MLVLHSGGGNAEPEPSDLVFRAMARIERECERAGDALEGVLVLHSLAGGTGSGLGCRLPVAGPNPQVWVGVGVYGAAP